MVLYLIISTPIICFTLIKYYLNCMIYMKVFKYFKKLFFIKFFLGTYKMQKFKTVDELINQLKPEQPIYCIRKKSIQSASTYFRKKFPGKVLYAVKTNPHPDVLKTIVESGIENFDVASIQEIKDIRAINRLMLSVPICTQLKVERISKKHTLTIM